MLPENKESEGADNPQIVIPNVPNVLPLFSLLSLPFLLLVLVIAVQWLNNPGGSLFSNRAKGAVEEKSIYVFQQGLESYGGTTDTQLRSDRVNRNFGSNAILKVQADNWILSLLRFDVGSIPPSSRVQNARLELYLSKKNDTKRFQLGLYKLLRPWTENQANWNLAAKRTSWGSEGANKIGVDREGFPVTTAYVGTIRQWYFLDVTSAVQGWVSNPAANYGFVLRGNDANDTEFHFNSANHSKNELRPRLIVTLESTGLPSPTPIVTSMPTSPLPTPTSSGLSPTPTTRPTSTPIPTARPTSTPAVLPTTVPGTWWKPTSVAPIHWQWVLSGTFTASSVIPNVTVYDIDWETTSASTVTALHNLGYKAICYFSAGTYEDWRPDASQFPAAALGNGNGWPGEKWVDIRNTALRGIMQARIQKCKDSGFDAIEPDNVDGYSNSTGFPLTSADQISYNTFLANEAHARGMGVALKNDISENDEQFKALWSVFDFTINEECFSYGECASVKTYFSDKNKAVFQVEYSNYSTAECTTAKGSRFNSIRRDMDLTLNGVRTPCIPDTQNTW